MYNHMKNRHNIEFTLKEFQEMFLYDGKFLKLYDEWVKNDYNKQFKPSLDRINCKKGYLKNNIQMLTWAENRFKQSALDGKMGRKPRVIQMLGNKIIKIHQSQRHAVKELGISQGNLSSVLNNKRQTTMGYKFIYENPELYERENK